MIDFTGRFNTEKSHIYVITITWGFPSNFCCSNFVDNHQGTHTAWASYMGNDQYISSNHCYYTDLRKHASFKKNNCWLLTIYPVSSIVLKDFYPLLYLIFTLIVEGSTIFYSHFTNEEIKLKRLGAIRCHFETFKNHLLPWMTEQ